MKTTLACWLRLLWDLAPPLRLDGESPHIVDGAIHLPAGAAWTDHTAAAAHAAAHLVYSPARFDGAGLGPIARCVLALLEDARVEALAIRELPGLARLWRPLHSATPGTGAGFEALMERLARGLIDPDYEDPHPWVRKGRALFYLDVRLGLPALRTPLELRGAAMRLGHDIGQMRMQFDAGSYCPAPRYRDDHRWMWAEERLDAVAPAGDEAGPAIRYPEWDRLISRLRPDWCSLSERPGPSSVATVPDAAVVQAGDRLRTPLRSLVRRSGVARRRNRGDAFDLDALVDSAIARRLRMPSDPRVHRARHARPAPAVVWLMVDRSSSTASRHGRGTLLDAALRGATATGLSLQRLGATFAVAGFGSNGRHDVRIELVKDFDGTDDEWTSRLGRLRPFGSTRLGAALRHATRRLARREGGTHLLLVLSDGRPQDVDIFGRDGVQRIGALRDLPRAIARIVAQ